MNLYTKQKQTYRHEKTSIWLPKGKARGRDELGEWN